MSPRKGIFSKLSVSRLSSKPPITKLCPSASSTSVLTRRIVRAGTRRAANIHCVCIVKSADFWSHLKPDRAAVGDRRQEGEQNAIFLILNGDRSRPTARRSGLRDRIRIFAAGKEAGLVSVLCQNIWLGEDFGQAFLLESLDRRTEIDARIEGKQVQRINGAKRCSRSCRYRESRRCGILIRRDPSRSCCRIQY